MRQKILDGFRLLTLRSEDIKLLVEVQRTKRSIKNIGVETKYDALFIYHVGQAHHYFRCISNIVDKDTAITEPKKIQMLAC